MCDRIDISKAHLVNMSVRLVHVYNIRSTPKNDQFSWVCFFSRPPFNGLGSTVAQWNRLFRQWSDVWMDSVSSIAVLPMQTTEQWNNYATHNWQKPAWEWTDVLSHACKWMKNVSMNECFRSPTCSMAADFPSEIINPSMTFFGIFLAFINLVLISFLPPPPQSLGIHKCDLQPNDLFIWIVWRRVFLMRFVLIGNDGSNIGSIVVNLKFEVLLRHQRMACREFKRNHLRNTQPNCACLSG